MLANSHPLTLITAPPTAHRDAPAHARVGSIRRRAVSRDASLTKMPDGDLRTDIDGQQIFGSLQRTCIGLPCLADDARRRRRVRIDGQLGFDPREYLARL